jgi:hypothetical protein
MKASYATIASFAFAIFSTTAVMAAPRCNAGPD